MSKNDESLLDSDTRYIGFHIYLSPTPVRGLHLHFILLKFGMSVNRGERELVIPTLNNNRIELGGGRLTLNTP